jgi:hypothetical protein
LFASPKATWYVFITFPYRHLREAQTTQQAHHKTSENPDEHAGIIAAEFQGVLRW